MKKSKNNSLFKTYIIIISVVCLILILSFGLFFIVTEKNYRQNAIDGSRRLYSQQLEEVKEYESAIADLFFLTTVSDTVSDYLTKEDFTEHVEDRPKVSQLFSGLTRIDSGVKSIMMYDSNGVLVGMIGEKFFLEEQTSQLEDSSERGYSNGFKEDSTNSIYFQVERPIYEKQDKNQYYFIGTVALLFDTHKLQNFVDTLALNNDSYAAVIDRNGDIVVDSGMKTEEYDNIICSDDAQEGYLVYQDSLSASGWKLINIIPRNSFMSYPNDIRKINIFTYTAVAIALIVLCVLFYKKVIQPIRRQMEFVVGYTKDMNQRIEVIEKNEFGELASRINEMLDELDELNKQVIESERKVLQMEYAKKQTEMIAYKGQINPHFMYNTLECIRGMALYRDEKEIAKLTGSLSKMFRYNVKGKEFVTINDVIKNLKEYAMIIDYRFMGKITILIEAENDAVKMKYIPKMIIQPLVENAVIHGLEPNISKGTAHVRFSETEDNHIKILVEDNGCGMSRTVLDNIHKQMELYDEDLAYASQQYGIGVSNVYRRIKLFYGNKVSFNISSEEGKGTCITMILPEEMEV